MARRSLLIFLFLSVFILNANIFNRVFDTSKKPSLARAQLTLFSLHAITHRYLDEDRIVPERMLEGALFNIEENYSPVSIEYDRAVQRVRMKVYNEKTVIDVVRIKDPMDIPVVLRQVYAFIQKNYHDDEEKPLDELEYVAVNGMLGKLDPHSHVFTPWEFKTFNSNTEGNFGGLGIVITKNEDGEIVIVSPIEGTPAMRAGLQSGDTIVQIEDRSAINMPLNNAVKIMRGKPGTDITVRIKRESVPELLEFSITRAVIKIKSVIPKIIDEKIGYLKITGFMQNTLSQMKKHLSTFRKKGITSLIIDFRNNAGGLLSQAIRMSDLFLENGVIVSTVEQTRKEDNTAEKQKADILDLPLVVLVNEGTASAAEIVTAALKTNDRTTVLGRKTFGKGSVQNIIPLPGGGGVKLTVAQYLTPGDISIQNVGITPDIRLLSVYLDEERIQVFRQQNEYLTEADLDRHIDSKYIPKEPQKPELSIRYFKEYKSLEELREERKMTRSDVFHSDQEIEIAVGLLDDGKKADRKSVISRAEQEQAEQWNLIVKKMKEMNVIWKQSGASEKIDPAKLTVSLTSPNTLAAGEKNTITFTAAYPGQVKNLFGALKTTIPFLENLEIPFGTFTDKVSRTIHVTLPEDMEWRRNNIPMELSIDKFNTVLKSESVLLETKPVDLPEIEFSFYLREHSGSINGLLETGEKVDAVIWMRNTGKGSVNDARLMLLNNNNSEHVFIEKGSSKVALKPGESQKVSLSFEVSPPASKPEKPANLSASLYDYASKYGSGFSIPLHKTVTTCSYSKKPRTAAIEKGTVLWSDVTAERKAAAVTNTGNYKITGGCGELSRLSNGLWVRTDRLRPVGKKKKNTVISPTFAVTMPKITVDESPVTEKDGAMDLNFSVSGDDVREIFIFINGRKVFYHWVEGDSSDLDFTVPLTFENKVNRVSIIARKKDDQRQTEKMKVVSYPSGKKKQY